MQSANQQLAEREPAEPVVAISDLQDDGSSLADSHSDEDTEQHVQMDIACGVLDLKDQAALRAVEAMLDGAEYAASSDSGSSSESDEEHVSAIGSEAAAVNRAVATDGLNSHACTPSCAHKSKQARVYSQAAPKPSKIVEL